MYKDMKTNQSLQTEMLNHVKLSSVDVTYTILNIYIQQ